MSKPALSGHPAALQAKRDVIVLALVHSKFASEGNGLWKNGEVAFS